jgi:hypothetical protein
VASCTRVRSRPHPSFEHLPIRSVILLVLSTRSREGHLAPLIVRYSSARQWGSRKLSSPGVGDHDHDRRGRLLDGRRRRRGVRLWQCALLGLARLGANVALHVRVTLLPDLGPVAAVVRGFAINRCSTLKQQYLRHMKSSAPHGRLREIGFPSPLTNTPALRRYPCSVMSWTLSERYATAMSATRRPGALGEARMCPRERRLYPRPTARTPTSRRRSI